MAYCTLSQLENRYGTSLLIDVSDRAGAADGAIDLDLVNRVIDDADALINGYLASRYSLPMAEVPAIITDLSQRIAIYYAHASTAPEKITNDYKAAMRELEHISKGVVRLTGVTGLEPAGGAGGLVLTNEPERPFSSETMKGWI